MFFNLKDSLKARYTKLTLTLKMQVLRHSEERWAFTLFMERAYACGQLSTLQRGSPRTLLIQSTLVTSDFSTTNPFSRYFFTAPFEIFVYKSRLHSLNNTSLLILVIDRTVTLSLWVDIIQVQRDKCGILVTLWSPILANGWPFIRSQVRKYWLSAHKEMTSTTSWWNQVTQSVIILKYCCYSSSCYSMLQLITRSRKAQEGSYRLDDMQVRQFSYPEM
jgi:hypothetical protein